MTLDEFVGFLGDPKTGIYFSEIRYRWEAWIVDSVQRRAHCIGWLSGDAVDALGEEAKELWASQVWRGFLAEGFAAVLT
jgi:hypothetical protein